MARKSKVMPNGKIAVRDQYTAGDLAYLLGVAHRTACKLIDEGVIAGFRLPSRPGNRLRERRVLHGAILAFIEANPRYAYILDKLDGASPASSSTGPKGGKTRWKIGQATFPALEQN
jgi:hypothetical protein